MKGPRSSSASCTSTGRPSSSACARYDDPTKRWKFNVGDLEERKLWDAYQAAFEDALSRCSTRDAPWYVIPANHKWFRNLAVGEIVTDTLAGLGLEYPARDDLPKNLVFS